jgi:phosphoenolpyruvate carboxykinase (GTP)
LEVQVGAGVPSRRRGVPQEDQGGGQQGPQGCLADVDVRRLAAGGAQQGHRVRRGDLDYVTHSVALGQDTDHTKLPKIFQVNWFRRDESGRFLWPGFGDNLRVIAWALGRVDGRTSARQTPVGRIPTAAGLDLSDLEVSPEQVGAALEVDIPAWRNEVVEIETWFSKIGDSLPTQLMGELDALRTRLESA